MVTKPNRVRVIHDLQLKENTCFTNCYESFSVSKNKFVWEALASLNATIKRANITALSFIETKLLLYLFLKKEQWRTFEKKSAQKVKHKGSSYNKRYHSYSETVITSDHCL